ncbi:MAG: DUF4286 family protein [Duncaniella sp.]|nr:DUF4286 family protein [Duncaniella sp.]
MIILNTTFYVHESIDSLFHQWLNHEYIPSAMKAGLSEPSVARLLMEPQEGMSGYAVQFVSGSVESAQTWHDNEAASLRGLLSGKHGERILFFTTYMERLHP